MMQIHPTAAELDRMQADRIRQAREQLAQVTTEEERKRLEARIWRIQNS